MKNRLWVESYRPQTIADYVFVNERQKNQVEGWVKDGSIPHLLLSGDPGTGKTTLAKVLIHELDVSEYDVLEINASRENSVDVVRNKIVNFVQTMPFGNFKVVL
jgi:DNA polymerase III delta prime subunit